MAPFRIVSRTSLSLSRVLERLAGAHFFFTHPWTSLGSVTCSRLHGISINKIFDTTASNATQIKTHKKTKCWWKCCPSKSESSFTIHNEANDLFWSSYLQRRIMHCNIHQTNLSSKPCTSVFSVYWAVQRRKTFLFFSFLFFSSSLIKSNHFFHYIFLKFILSILHWAKVHC